MIPSAMEFAILALAAFRLTRLAGWDDFPLAARIRAWAIGERWVLSVPPEIVRVELAEGEKLSDHVSQFPVPAMQEIGKSADEPLSRDAESLRLPGKQPPSEVDDVRPAYDRPTLAHLVHCPFCVGWWISLATWLAWVAWHPVAYGLAPFAISGAVGLVAKNLDA